MGEHTYVRRFNFYFTINKDRLNVTDGRLARPRGTYVVKATSWWASVQATVSGNREIVAAAPKRPHEIVLYV